LRIIDANCLFGRWPKQNLDVSAEHLIEALQELDIAKGLAVSLRGVFYSHAEGNRETLEVCAQHDCLVPVATICPAQYTAGEDSPGRLRERGFRMLRLFPDMQGWSLSNILAERVLQDCAEADMPVAVNVVKTAGVASDLVRLAPEGCRVVLSGIYYHTLAEAAEALRRRGEFLMEVGRTCMPSSVEMLCQRVGAGRLVLGTTQPLDLGRGPIEMVRHASISEEDQAAILGGSLDALLGGI
jgi:predicted TIM-barrel fold metal-dependent hydrolase